MDFGTGTPNAAKGHNKEGMWDKHKLDDHEDFPKNY